MVKIYFEKPQLGVCIHTNNFRFVVRNSKMPLEPGQYFLCYSLTNLEIKSILQNSIKNFDIHEFC